MPDLTYSRLDRSGLELTEHQTRKHTMATLNITKAHKPSLMRLFVYSEGNRLSIHPGHCWDVRHVSHVDGWYSNADSLSNHYVVAAWSFESQRWNVIEDTIATL